MASQHLQTILNKEVSRKEFLGLSALAVASIFGFGTVVHMLTGKSLDTHKVLSDAGNNDKYGGKKPAASKVA